MITIQKYECVYIIYIWHLIHLVEHFVWAFKKTKSLILKIFWGGVKPLIINGLLPQHPPKNTHALTH